MSTINQQVDGNGNTFSGSGDVHRNSFTCHGGTQNSAQGDGSIGCQINNYNTNPPPPPVIPNHRPPLEPCFLHRDEELVWLNERLHPGKVVAVCGPGGMGKSALAAKAVHQLEPARFPDGIVFYSFYGKPSAQGAIAYIVRSYDEHQQDVSPDAARRLLANKQALLMLDGTEQADDLKAVLDLCGQCGVLITSRKTEDALDEFRELKRLDKQQAEEVFRRYSELVGDDANVQGICKILDGWPVALRIAGRYLRSTKESTATYLRFLSQVPFKRLGSGKHQEENAALLLRRSVEKVSEDAQLALSMAGCLAFAPIACEPLAAILDRDELRSCDALNELVTYGLLERNGERWQTSHALIHTYARTELALSKDTLWWLAWYYIRFSYEQSEAGLEGYARLDPERAHCLRLIESCLASKLWLEVKLLILAINTYLDRQGWWTERLTILEMRLTAARQADDRKDESHCLNDLGYTCWKRGEHEQAFKWFDQCLLIRRELGDRKGETVTLSNIATIYQKQGKYDLALNQYQQILSIRREIGDREGEGNSLHNIGTVYRVQEDYEIALQYYEKSLHIAQEIGNKIWEGVTLNNIADIYNVQGNSAKALEYHQQALAIRQQLGDISGEAESRWNIGLIYMDLGDLAKAEEHIRLAGQIMGAISHPFLETLREELTEVQAARRG